MGQPHRDLLEGIAFVSMLLSRTEEYSDIELRSGEEFELNQLIEALERLRPEESK